MEITPKTKIDTLLKTFPKLEAYLMTLHPKYKNLKNPILRRTIAKIATLSQVARIGGFNRLELVNLLRKEVGQHPLADESIDELTLSSDIPSQTPKVELDVKAILAEEGNPLKELHQALAKLEVNDVVLLKSDFEPAPLIDTISKEGHKVSMKQEGSNYFTYVVKA